MTPNATEPHTMTKSASSDEVHRKVSPSHPKEDSSTSKEADSAVTTPSKAIEEKQPSLEKPPDLVKETHPPEHHTPAATQPQQAPDTSALVDKGSMGGPLEAPPSAPAPIATSTGSSSSVQVDASKLESTNSIEIKAEAVSTTTTTQLQQQSLAPDAIPLVTPPTLPQQNPPPISPPQTTNKQQHQGTASAKKTSRGVPHVYHDYSNVPDTVGFVRKKTGGVTTPFPEKLHEMLSNESADSSVVGWLPHGRAFIVRKPKAFTDQIMAKYFKQTKLTSFQRQLNLYGFRRITQGPDAGAYYHELFLRGRPQLAMRMNRQKVKGTGHKQPADSQTEPNFYAMPHQPSLAAGGSATTSNNVTTTTTTSSWLTSTNEPQHAAQLPNSPGIQGLHGAANLLKGIAAGVPPGWTLAPPATTATTSTSSITTTATGAATCNAHSSSSAPSTKHQQQQTQGRHSWDSDAYGTRAAATASTSSSGFEAGSTTNAFTAASFYPQAATSSSNQDGSRETGSATFRQSSSSAWDPQQNPRIRQEEV